MSNTENIEKVEQLKKEINDNENLKNSLEDCGAILTPHDEKKWYEKLFTAKPQIMAKGLEAYDANEPDKKEVDKTKVKKIKKIFGF
jgi:hypothetical protein